MPLWHNMDASTLQQHHSNGRNSVTRSLHSSCSMSSTRSINTRTVAAIATLLLLLHSTFIVVNGQGTPHSGDIYNGNHEANYSAGWDIWVNNESGQALQFLLFQKQFEPGVDSYQAAWRVGMLPSPGSAGPFHLPHDVYAFPSQLDR